VPAQILPLIEEKHPALDRLLPPSHFRKTTEIELGERTLSIARREVTSAAS